MKETIEFFKKETTVCLLFLRTEESHSILFNDQPTIANKHTNNNKKLGFIV